MPHPTSWRVSRNLLGWMLLLSIVPLLFTNAVGYSRTQAIIVRLVARYLGAVAQEQAQHARDHIDREVILLHSVASGSTILLRGTQAALRTSIGSAAKSPSPADVKNELQRRIVEMPSISALFIVSPGGLLISSVGNTDVAVTVGLPTNPTQPNVDVIPADASRPAPMVRLLAPIADSSGTTVAWLGGIITRSSFRELLELPEHFAGEVESYVIDDAGRLLITTRANAAIDFAKPLPLPTGLSTQPAVLYNNTDGMRVFGASAEIPGYHWRVVVEASAAEALDELEQLGEASMALGSLLVGGIVLTAWLVTRGIVRPLRRLARAAERVAEGDLESRVPVETDDEIGDLGRAFNDMTVALHDANDRVRELHDREIERASRLATVGELASGVAHEIKNPLVGIASGLDLVRRHVTNVAELDPVMDEMSRQLARIQSTLHDLLAYARPATPALSPVSATAVIARALRLVQPAATRQGVSFVVDADAEAPSFLADEELLRQALVNLLMNAVQATPAGGQITIRARAEGSWVDIAVEDSGHGISPANLEAVFKPFFTTRHAGTGLGLSISREIVERHGGSLRLQSEVGFGTIVTVRIPARRDDVPLRDTA